MGDYTNPDNFQPLQADNDIWNTGITSGDNQWLNFNASGGHPGTGGASAKCAIVSYTIPADGDYKLKEGFITLTNTNFGGSLDGILVMYSINDNFPTGFNKLLAWPRSDYPHANFPEKNLLNLKYGDKIYVYFHPLGNNTRDGFKFDFTIEKEDRENGVPANYQDDFSSGIMPEGWNYLWCSEENIGKPTEYNFLTLAGLNWTEPSISWMRLSQQGGHAGANSYVIASYTIPEDGHYEIGESDLNLNHPNGDSDDGVELKIHINNDPFIIEGEADNSNPLEFNTDLGYLYCGDEVYICVGDNQNVVRDAFFLNFTIQKLQTGFTPNATTTNGFPQGIYFRHPSLKKDGLLDGGDNCDSLLIGGSCET